MIRPHLKKKYSTLCNLNTPVTSFLFGVDVQKEIKKCDTSKTSIRVIPTTEITIISVLSETGLEEEVALSGFTAHTHVVIITNHILDSLLR